MKKRIIGLSLLFSFLTFLALGSVLSAFFVKKYSSDMIEHVTEDRIMEKEIKISSDDNSIFISNISIFNVRQKVITFVFKHEIYTFEFKNTLFKPPIFT